MFTQSCFNAEETKGPTSLYLNFNFMFDMLENNHFKVTIPPILLNTLAKYRQKYHGEPTIKKEARCQETPEQIEEEGSLGKKQKREYNWASNKGKSNKHPHLLLGKAEKISTLIAHYVRYSRDRIPNGKRGVKICLWYHFEEESKTDCYFDSSHWQLCRDGKLKMEMF